MNRLSIIFTLFVLIAAGAAYAKELTGEEIAKMAEENNSLTIDNASARIKMVINTKHGAKRERVIESKMKRDGSTTKKFIRFMEPPDIRGTGFLSIEEKGKETDQRLYLPAIKTDRRIRSNQKSDSFMGTDFTYKDLEGRDVSKAKHERKPDEKVNGIDCYAVESIPNTPEDSGYSKYISYVGKHTKVPIRVRFFDMKGAELKVLTVKKLKKVEGKWVATESEMKNLQEKTSTDLIIETVTFSEKIEDDIFTVRNLKRG